jgi:hypothetical protein
MPYTAAQLGHRDGRFTLSVYAHAFKHRSKLTGAEGKAYDTALQWARLGTNAADGARPVIDIDNARERIPTS